MRAAASSWARSAAVAAPSLGNGPGSLKPSPARSYAQARLVRATRGWVFAQVQIVPAKPDSKITVGLPCPVQ